MTSEAAIERAKRLIENVEKRRDNKIDLEDFGLHDIGFITKE